MLLSIQHITGAAVGDVAVTVTCQRHDYPHPLRTFEVVISADTVTVREAGRETAPAEVMVSIDLIDATRRLFNMVTA